MLGRMPQSSYQPPRLNVTEAAAYTGISASTLNKLRVFGGGAIYSKIGRRVVYEVDALDAWLSTKQRTSTSDTGEVGAPSTSQVRQAISNARAKL